MKQTKKNLVFSLELQVYNMFNNAKRMREIYGAECQNASELEGAANITKQWINKINQEIKEEAG